MPCLPALRRPAAALAMALLLMSFTGCGQTGKLFLREPLVTFAPQIITRPAPIKMILLPAETTGMLPAGATRLAPVAAPPSRT